MGYPTDAETNYGSVFLANVYIFSWDHLVLTNNIVCHSRQRTGEHEGERQVMALTRSWASSELASRFRFGLGMAQFPDFTDVSSKLV
jgi:hypothetical protein